MDFEGWRRAGTGYRVLLELFTKTSMGEIVLGNDHQTYSTTEISLASAKVWLKPYQQHGSSSIDFLSSKVIFSKMAFPPFALYYTLEPD